MAFSRQEYWCGLPFPTPGYLPNPGIEPRSPVSQADSQYLPNLFLTYSYTFTFDFFCLIVDLLQPRQFTSEKCSVCLASIATSSQEKRPCLWTNSLSRRKKRQCKHVWERPAPDGARGTWLRGNNRGKEERAPFHRGRAERASCGNSAARLLSPVQPRTATTQGLGTGRAAGHRHSWRRPETLGLGKRALRQRQGSACLCHPKHFCRGKKLLRSNAPCPEPVTHKCPVREWVFSPTWLTRLFFISSTKSGHGGRNTGQGWAVAVLWNLCLLLPVRRI